MRLLASGNADASQALQTTPPAAPEKPTRCSASPQEAHAASCGAKPPATSSLRRNASWCAGPAAARVVVEQPQLVREQVEDGRRRVVGLEQPRDRVARARGGVERGGALAQRAVRVERLGARDGQQLRPALVEDRAQVEERLQPRAEAAARAARALRDRADTRPRSGV